VTAETQEAQKAYRRKLRAQLDEWEAELNKLQARTEKAAADVRLKKEEQLRRLRENKDALRAKLEALQTAGGDAWDRLKEGTDKAWNDFKEAVGRARAEFHGL
jgi:chromosome segregation ATPase